MRVTIAQLNPVVGDVFGNVAKAQKAIKSAVAQESDLIVFSELFVVGYPPKDLLERQWFLRKTEEAFADLLKTSANYPDLGIIVGMPQKSPAKTGKLLYNSACLVLNGKKHFSQAKSLLPTYDVFDEARHFVSAEQIDVVEFKGRKLGISICEDAWNVPDLAPDLLLRYGNDPLAELARRGADLFINISASPFRLGKPLTRFKLVSSHASRHKIPFVFVNQVGGNDELIFDGRSMFLDDHGRPLIICDAFKEQVVTFEIDQQNNKAEFYEESRIESVYRALILGLTDYADKCGFDKAVIGISGGIDSAVVACVAQAALGPENVLGVSMPSMYSSPGSMEDAKRLALNLGIGFKIIPITDIFKEYSASLKGDLDKSGSGVAEENIQARIRGNILMAISNNIGHLVLSTGNKSELAVGYCTLYGDMSGGLSVLSDVPKTMVYELADFINNDKQLIPPEIISKPPSAELKPDQLDQDTLPPYEILDQILNLYIEESLSVEEIAANGFDKSTVLWVARAVDRNEYKRKQAAPGLKITSKAFGVGRRMPIAAKYDY